MGVPTGPGIGVIPVPERLRERVVRRELLRASDKE